MQVSMKIEYGIGAVFTVGLDGNAYHVVTVVKTDHAMSQGRHSLVDQQGKHDVQRRAVAIVAAFAGVVFFLFTLGGLTGVTDITPLAGMYGMTAGAGKTLVIRVKQGNGFHVAERFQ